MKLVIYTTIRSPHLMPLASGLARQLGSGQFRYVYTVYCDKARKGMGWGGDDAEWCEYAKEGYGSAIDADCALTCIRDSAFIRQRLKGERKTCYLSERWLKPPFGILRLLHPRYLQMAREFCNFFQSPEFTYFAIGIHAARDVIRLYELLKENKPSRLIHAPEVAFESRPGGAILPLKEAIEQDLIQDKEIPIAIANGFYQIPKNKWGHAKPQGIYAKVKIWGYFVEPSRKQTDSQSKNGILWCGRLLKLKKVDTLIRACNELNLPLDIYGDGPEKPRLQKLAGSSVRFYPFVPIEKVRQIMREHKTYVLPSNGYEGWGAVVNEALEEGMVVYASCESGAGATILPRERLFHFNDYKRLASLLSQGNTPLTIGEWSARNAANYIVDILMK